ncbi:MAG: hypothetical protein R3E77_05290 [Steroidobacteraceae bacterium]
MDGNLYLFVNGAIFDKYVADNERILADAKRIWPSIEHKAVNKL